MPSNEELRIKAPHTKEVDGELIPNFMGMPRTLTTGEPFPKERQIEERDYFRVAKRYQKKAEEHRQQLEDGFYRKRLTEEETKLVKHYNAFLTDREKDLLYIIRSFQWMERYSPTAWELGLITGTSSQNMRKYLNRLVDKGMLEWSPHHKSRDYMKRILFPRGMWFPWHDYTQFPTKMFWDKNKDRYGDIATHTHDFPLL